MTALMPDRTRPSAGELQRDLRHRRPLVLLATLAGGRRRGQHAAGLPGARGGRLVPHRRRRPRRTPRRALGRRAGLADGPRLRASTSTARWSPSMPLGHHAGLRLGDLADRPPARRLDLGPRPGRRRGSPTASATGRSRPRRCSTPPATSSSRSSPARSPRPPRPPRHLAGRALVVPALRRARRPGDRDRLRPRRDLGRHPARRRCVAAAAACRQVLTAVARSSPLLAFLVALVARLRHRAQRDLAARHRHRRHRAAGRRLAAGGAQRGGLLRLLPARPRLHGRHPHDRVARAWSPSARCRCSRCWPRCPTPARRRAGPPCLVGVPPVVAALGAMRAQRRHPTFRWEEGALHGCAGGMLAGARCSASSRCWPAARSARAG